MSYEFNGKSVEIRHFDDIKERIDNHNFIDRHVININWENSDINVINKDNIDI